MGLKLFILAGEASGDRLGADLVARLRQADPDLELTGVGGENLIARGLRSLFPMRELSVMGWADILPRLPWLLMRARQTARAIVRSRPDVVVFVDAQLFSKKVAGHVRAAGGKLPMALYVAPAVWAWEPERAAKLTALFDEVLAVLPFEPAFMAAHGGPKTHYVGHSALARLPARAELPERGPLLLLPGSRTGELRRNLPQIRAVAEELASHERVSELVLPTLGWLADQLRRETARWSVPVRVVTGAGDRAEAFRAAVAAAAVTGTATLELALSGIPQVGTYVGDKGQIERWIKYEARFAALPNIILGREVMPEVLYAPPVDPQRLVDAVRAILEPAVAEAQVAAFAEMRTLMEKGAPEAPLVDAAERVRALVDQRRAIGS